MRTVLLIAIVSSVVCPAFAKHTEKDWGQMNVKERLAWTSTYIKSTCPKGLTTHDYGREDEIKNAPQFGVKIYVNFHCKA